MWRWGGREIEKRGEIGWVEVEISVRLKVRAKTRLTGSGKGVGLCCVIKNLVFVSGSWEAGSKSL